MTRTIGAGRNESASLYPVERFAADFGRFLTDVDRLMTDVSAVIEHPNSDTLHKERNKRGGNGSTLTLSEQARSFASSLRHFAGFYQRVPIPYMELDGDGHILRTNKECSRALSDNGRPILGRSLFNFVAASDVPRLRKQLAICSRQDEPGTIGTLIKGKDSPVELRIRRHFVDGEEGYLAVLLEGADEPESRTELRRHSNGYPPSLEELCWSLNRAYTLTSVVQVIGEYCSVTLSSPEGMIFVEHEGKLQLVWQWESRHASKKPPTPEISQKGWVTHALRTGNPIFWSLTANGHSNLSRYLRHAFPETKNANGVLLPIAVSGGRPVGAIMMVLLNRDIRAFEFRHEMHRLGELASSCIARARAYDEALMELTQAEKANKRKEEFFSVLSHELKNPLAPILGWAVALSSGVLSAEKQSLAVEGMIRNARALNYLIEDLFDAARISSGKLRLDVSEMRIQEVVREALLAIQPAAESKKLRISTDISEAVPPFLADARRVRQVLMNLLNNAIKFTPSGGSIALKVFRRGRIVQCAVSDSGRGIDPKFLPFVFDRFRQETASDSARASGLGLGLTIVKEIAELHGGSVKAQSLGHDKGATFTVQLPIRTKK